jgi:hypothetical protein
VNVHERLGLATKCATRSFLYGDCTPGGKNASGELNSLQNMMTGFGNSLQRNIFLGARFADCGLQIAR